MSKKRNTLESKSALTASWTNTIAIILAAIIGVAIGFIIQALPLISSWKSVQIGLLVVTAVVVIATVVWRVVRGRHAGKSWAGLIVALATLPVAWFFTLDVCFGSSMDWRSQEPGSRRRVPRSKTDGRHALHL